MAQPSAVRIVIGPVLVSQDSTVVVVHGRGCRRAHARMSTVIMAGGIHATCTCVVMVSVESL